MVGEVEEVEELALAFGRWVWWCSSAAVQQRSSAVGGGSGRGRVWAGEGGRE